jgi:TPR repeat protein
MNPIKVLSLLGLLSIVLNVSCRPFKPPSVVLSVGQQAYDKGDYAAALKVFRPMANQGNPDAQSWLGFMSENGNGIAQNYTEAIKWYRLAAKQGSSYAQNNLGALYANGSGVPQDYKEAAKWYRLAADQGLPEAQHRLGDSYSLGHGVPQDDKEAAKWLRFAADQGVPEAQNSLGWHYTNGSGVPQDYKEAVRWYRLAADQGLPEAQDNLGDMYDMGWGIPKDHIQAHMWYNLSAANGYGEGIRNRNRIAQKLTPAQLAEAQRLALEWKPRTGKDEGVPPSLPEGFTPTPQSFVADAPNSAETHLSAAPAQKSAPRMLTFDVSDVDDTSKVNAAGTAQSIQAAARAGLVRTSYRSLDGGSSGDSVLLIAVKIGGPDRLALSIPPGLALKSPVPSSQDMVVSGLRGHEIAGGKYTPEQVVILTDNKPVRYVVEAYCAEFHKDNPPPGMSDFQVGATSDPVLTCILNGARKEKLSIAGTQAAVWVRTDHVTFPEMNTRMAIGKEEWSKAETVVSRCTSN